MSQRGHGEETGEAILTSGWPRRGGFPQWVVVVLITALTWVASAAFTYGVFQTKMNQLEEQQKADEQRVSQIEQRQLDVMAHYLTRDEYLVFYKQMNDKIDTNEVRTQEKLDKLNQLLLAHMQQMAKLKD